MVRKPHEVETRYLRERTLYPPFDATAPSENLGLVVVIPAKDEDGLVDALESLRRCDATTCDVEVIALVNTAEHDTSATVESNREIADRARTWAGEHSTTNRSFQVHFVPNLKKKHAGAGLARKIGMDEACRRLEAAGRPRGVIACYDADCSCDANYLRALEAHFERKETCQAATVYFEHPLEGADFSEEIYNAIAQYELHLRYYINAQRCAGLPFAFHTVGSSMAVRCVAYQQQNGMVKNKAGEDFYFLHKFTPLGAVEEINSTRVVPSPRISRRAPFGTGRAMAEMLESGAPLQTYHPDSFDDLKALKPAVPRLFEGAMIDLPSVLDRFLNEIELDRHVAEIRSNVTNIARFENRFFRWFDAFRTLKFLHYSRDAGRSDVPVLEAAKHLLGRDDGTARELLLALRERDREGKL